MVLPIAFQSFMTAAVSASDAIMLGFIEQESLSAVSLAGQLVFIVNLIITVLMQGTSMLAAQYWGKGDAERVEMILGLAVRYSLYVLTVYFIICLDECVKVPVAFWYYRKYNWARNITRS
ncbi:MAG: MATE family efflux transporter [Rikenellaceae bacterium]|nr:MATE family efflux transporter [Rikenellaceae bacterium]